MTARHWQFSALEQNEGASQCRLEERANLKPRPQPKLQVGWGCILKLVTSSRVQGLQAVTSLLVNRLADSPGRVCIILGPFSALVARGAPTLCKGAST